MIENATTNANDANEEMLTERLRVVRRLGQGGQASVFEVEDLDSKDHYAVKLIPVAAQKEGGMIARLEHEAITAAAILHPNIVRIYGLEETKQGRRFLRMEMLSGRTLRQLLEDTKALPIPLATDLAIQIARGLQAAHAQGVIHRDLKPSNIFLIDRPGGGYAVKIMDFGIAKAHESWELTQLTETGNLIGTPAYMAPEQAMSGTELDGRADIYSLGVVLFEMLTGERPFRGTVVQTIVMQLQRPPPDPRTLRSEISPVLSAIVLRALEKPREQRFQSMMELAHALEERAKTKYVPSPASSPSHASHVSPATLSTLSFEVPAPQPPRRDMAHLVWAGLAVIASGVFAYFTVQGNEQVIRAPLRAQPEDVALVKHAVAPEISAPEPPAFERAQPEPVAQKPPVQEEPAPERIAEVSWPELNKKLATILMRRGLSSRDLEVLDPELARAWLALKNNSSSITDLEITFARVEEMARVSSIGPDVLLQKLDRVLSIMSHTPKDKIDEHFRRLEKNYISLRGQAQEYDPGRAEQLAREITRLESDVEKRYRGKVR